MHTCTCVCMYVYWCIYVGACNICIPTGCICSLHIYVCKYVCTCTCAYACMFTWTCCHILYMHTREGLGFGALCIYTCYVCIHMYTAHLYMYKYISNIYLYSTQMCIYIQHIHTQGWHVYLYTHICIHDCVMLSGLVSLGFAF
jgi:hypothetical protein